MNTSELIICPECGQAKSNIKRYVLFETVIFILIAVRYKFNVYICCSECMKKNIIKKTFNFNILTAWFLWLILILPWHFIAYLLTYTNGHSLLIKKQFN